MNNLMKNTPKYNILLALRQTNSLSGTPNILRRQAKALKKLGQVSVISENFHPDLLSDSEIKCLKAYKWPKNSLFQRRFFDLLAKRFTKKAKKPFVIGHGDTLEQDILCMHTCVHLAAEIFGDKNKKNLSIPFHRMIFEKGKFERIICNSKLMRDDFQKRFNIAVPMDIIYPGHNEKILERVNQEEVQKIRANLSGVVLGVITSGDLVNRGAFALIEAVSLLSKENKKAVSILIVGKEKHPEKIFDFAKNFGLEKQIHWMKPRLDVENLFASIDILVHAAKIETFGMGVLEGMSIGRPVIATRTVGCTELFPKDQQDFIISEQSSSEIAKRLEKLIPNQELREKLGKENRDVALKYTWDRYDEKFLEVVSQDLTGP